MSGEEQAAWRRRTEAVTGLFLAGVVFVCLTPFMVPRQVTAFGTPLAGFVATIVIPLAAAAAIFAAARSQDRVDIGHGA